MLFLLTNASPIDSYTSAHPEKLSCNLSLTLLCFELHIYYNYRHTHYFVIMGDIKSMTLHLYHKNNKQILYEYNTLCNRYALLMLVMYFCNILTL